MTKAIVILMALAAIMPMRVLSQEDRPDLQVMMCQNNVGVAAFAFMRSPEGTLALIGDTDATVTKLGSTITVLLDDRILQFQGSHLQTLKDGLLERSDCTEVTDTVVNLVNLLSSAEPAMSSMTGSIIPIGTPSENGSVALTMTERTAFVNRISRCWNIDPGSVAARLTVEVGFNLNRDQTVEGNEVHLLSSNRDAAAGSAFEAARRAILRCQSGGFDLPLEKYDQWREVVLNFGPTGIHLR